MTLRSRMHIIRDDWYAAMFDPGEVEPTFSNIFAHLRRNFGKIITVALVTAFIGFVAAWVQTPRYVATMEIIPNTVDKAGLSRILDPSANPLATLTSLPFGKSEQVTRFQQFNHLMLSPDVADGMEKRLHLLQHIYPEDWDASTGNWKSDPDYIWNAIRRFLNLPAPTHPDRYTLQEYLTKHIDISEDKKTAALTLSYSDTNRQMAGQVLLALYLVTDNLIIDRNKKLIRARLEQAQKNLPDTTLKSDRKALTDLLTHYNLLAIETKVGSPYAALRMSGPDVQLYPTDPSVLRYVLVAFSLGLLISIALLTAKVLRT